MFIGAGIADTIAPPAQADRLAAILTAAGADVTIHRSPGGHTVSAGEIDAARKWIERSLAAAGSTAHTSESRAQPR